MSLLSTSNLNIRIGNTAVCHKLNITCEAGEVWGILGRNGKGKTTLLHTLAGLRASVSGEILIRENNILELSRKKIARQLGVLLQHHEDSFPATVLQTVITGRHPHLNHWQWESPSDWECAHQALSTVQLSHLSERPINQLSGGERQRVAIATLITQNPDIMLLDEPNSHLDLKYQVQLLNQLCQQTRAQGKTIIMTLHDINLAARYCDKLILLLGDGDTLTGTSEELLNESNLHKLYDHPISRIESDGYPFF
ncbi:MAG: ABC transporter ATP-binding protein, partial [Gammaproteobacteria bacterium]|nr:ABC transporter ATP-binding protein [Gammaproteobacteria bacterium]